MTFSASTALDSWSVRYVASSRWTSGSSPIGTTMRSKLSLSNTWFLPQMPTVGQQEQQARQHDEQTHAPSAEAPTALRRLVGVRWGRRRSARAGWPVAGVADPAVARRCRSHVGGVASPAGPGSGESLPRLAVAGSFAGAGSAGRPPSSPPARPPLGPPPRPVTDVSLPSAGFSLDVPFGLSLCLCFCLPFAVGFAAVSTSSFGTSASFGSAVGDPATIWIVRRGTTRAV